MNILVVCDTSWDNYAEISRRLTSKNKYFLWKTHEMYQ